VKLKEKLYSLVDKYDSLIIFLVIECLALTAFSLADANIIFRYLGFLISFALIPFALMFTSKKEWLSLGLFSIPLVIIAFLTGFSTFTVSMGFGLLDNASVLLGTLAFFFLGFAVRRVKKFKIDIALLTIGAAMAILVFLSLVYSLYQYGPFHAAIYQGMVYYYDGRLFIVSDETKWLLGFSFAEISPNYVALFGTMLSTALVGLLYISPRQEPRKFYITAAIGAVGLLSVILIPNLEALYLLIPVALFALLYRFVKAREKAGAILQYAFFAVVGIAGIALLVAVLNAAGVAFLSNAISGNAFLNRLFNTNRIMSPVNDVLMSMFTAQGLFGYPTVFIESLVANTGAFEFEIIKEGGFFAFLAIIAFLFLVIFTVTRYSAKSKDPGYIKAIIISLLIATLLHGSFLWQTFPLVYEDDYYFSFFRSAPYLIVLFIIGYAYYPLRGTPLVEQPEAFELTRAGEGVTITKTDDEEEEIKL
jgi:hypothetical protein